jgi:hypothetical protein
MARLQLNMLLRAFNISSVVGSKCNQIRVMMTVLHYISSKAIYSKEGRDKARGTVTPYLKNVKYRHLYFSGLLTQYLFSHDIVFVSCLLIFLPFSSFCGALRQSHPMWSFFTQCTITSIYISLTEIIT